MLTLYSFRAMTQHGPGELHQLVLLAVVHLGGEAFRVARVNPVISLLSE